MAACATRTWSSILQPRARDALPGPLPVQRDGIDGHDAAAQPLDEFSRLPRVPTADIEHGVTGTHAELHEHIEQDIGCARVAAASDARYQIEVPRPQISPCSSVMEVAIAVMLPWSAPSRGELPRRRDPSRRSPCGRRSWAA